MILFLHSFTVYSVETSDVTFGKLTKLEQNQTGTNTREHEKLKTSEAR